ncbi:DUF1554 domain-containing protein [Leptospira levettii]|uniref:DUF1554 domain-containing protein n=1 Tax=Leptospira levettii TaxID=2023178 RepID=UPI001EEC577A|nr:DUF1554 domain-containing protein [Leptospira levettii]MCG6147392.1 DUF1554 domain-containing protein [Leptospira levettii]MCW7507463.1 DUF1554 domain-containing protein [Leptospira levettii]MCW7518553.1 DUF1554 domain-containing protein [Leptospira levettii]
MQYLFLLLFFLMFQCTQPTLNNPSDIQSDAFKENETLLCLTGQLSACRIPVPVCTTCRFFSTSVTYDGNRGGIVGADAKCMADSKKPTEPVGAVYKAFLVDDVNRIACTTSNCTTGGNSEHKDWILKPNTTYKRAVDTVIIATTNSVGIFTTQTNDAENPTVIDVFTGLDTSGWLTRVSGDHCTRWTSNAVSGAATNSSSLTTSTLRACSTTSAMLCVEQ